MSDISSDDILSVSSDKNTLDGGFFAGSNLIIGLLLLILGSSVCITIGTLSYIIHNKKNC